MNIGTEVRSVKGYLKANSIHVIASMMKLIKFIVQKIHLVSLTSS